MSFPNGFKCTGLATVIALVLAACDASVSENEAGVSSSNESGIQKSLAIGEVNPENWPSAKNPFGPQPDVERRVDEIMSKMTLREKVGQVIQADIGSITPQDLETYPLGSVLNGGNSAPNGDNRSPAIDWVKLADDFYESSKKAYEDEASFIPMIWGTDAVHGHNNVPGATLFPHNIGLGAARNPDLMREIGAITARETRVSSHEWTFAPTVAVVRDDRWGRTYEGYSEEPTITASFTAALIQGIQGNPSDDDFLKGPHVIATAKHFLGDGGTKDGRDQGDNIDSEADLRDIHGAAYPIAIEAGVQAIMPSFSSWHGRKVTGHKGVLTGILKERMNFDGFLIGDWNAHGQIEGCTVTDCPQALHAGLDMYMAPDSWKGLFETMLVQAETGELNLDRLDDAVRRILRVKVRTGLFEAGKPSSRAYAGDVEILADTKSKDIARQAVRESLVLLKNDGVLPLSPNQVVLVAGDGADDIGKQSGGWTLSWQGTGNSKKDFPGGSSMFDGVKRHVEAAGGEAVLSVDGSYEQKPDVAIVVFGEDPYAEFVGDRDSLAYKPEDDRDLDLLKSLQAQGIPTISVFLSGRPLWVNREINASNAFVAAWLPGSEGGYAMDVLFSESNGKASHDFKGKLSYSWPREVMQTPLNVGDKDYDPLFAFGYGLSYTKGGQVGVLSEDPGADVLGVNLEDYLNTGRAIAPWGIRLADESGQEFVETTPAKSKDSVLSLRTMDDGVQENILTVEHNGKGEASFALTGSPADLSRQLTGDMALYLRVRPEALKGNEKLSLSIDCSVRCDREFDLGNYLKGQSLGEWTELSVKLSCFGPAEDLDQVTAPIVISSNHAFKMSLSDVRLVPNEGQAICLPAL